ncbi:hypothetical protein F5X71_08400 [Nocardia brasiliensis]|uniref:Uncharacterized protein n=1 Tax=Nocardia brasiliensis TaxID=37326 RepID=A0A6G9XN20_NOCBR|nr:hypothetical protein [Nocardia brasiliensis]QIS02341.1 hypothetical protein F5X71_08400 [Nocardia brasiliensis]
MHGEHEEAMREAFTELDRLTRLAYRPQASEADIQRLYTEGAAIDQGWHYGPHQRQWEFLKAVRSQWECEPEAVRQALRYCGGNGGFDPVQRRSIEQARILSAAAPRPDIERGR